MKKQIINLILVLLTFSLSIENSNARHLTDNKPANKTEKNLNINQTNKVSTLNCTKEYVLFNINEFESELPVTDLDEINFLPQISWMFPSVEEELEVTDLKPTEQILPVWMNVEKEPELEVLDLIND